MVERMDDKTWENRSCKAEKSVALVWHAVVRKCPMT